MINIPIDQTDPFKTVRQVLPYTFRTTMNNRIVVICRPDGEEMVMAVVDVQHKLMGELDTHRRKMYEAAMAYVTEQASQ